MKNVDNLDIPLTFAFFSFSTPCEPFFRFLAPSEAVGPAFDLLMTGATKYCSFARDFTCASSFTKLIWLVSISHPEELHRIRTHTLRGAPRKRPVEGIVPATHKPASSFPLRVVFGGYPFTHNHHSRSSKSSFLSSISASLARLRTRHRDISVMRGVDNVATFFRSSCTSFSDEYLNTVISAVISKTTRVRTRCM